MRDHLRNLRSGTVAFVWTYRARPLGENRPSELETISSVQVSGRSNLQEPTQSTCDTDPHDQLAKLKEVAVSIFLSSIVLLFRSITAPTCWSRDSGVKGGTPGLSTTVYLTTPLTPYIPEGIFSLPNTLALPPMPTTLLLLWMTQSFSPNL